MGELIITEKEKIDNIVAAVRKVTESNELLSLEEIAENINLMDGFIPKPQRAEVGQILTVKEVDENGLPTEYEAVYPQFIGYERLFELTTTEAISSVSAALENPGYFSDLLIVAKIKESSGTHGIYYGGASNPILKLGKLVSDSKMMVVAMVAEICETHSGELEDPIPYSGNMALEKGKYYFENNGIYLCIRDTINPVYHKLSELIGLYVEEV